MQLNNNRGMVAHNMCTIETSKRKRGRPKGSKNKSKHCEEGGSSGSYSKENSPN
jgi:hypothetical protein